MKKVYLLLCLSIVLFACKKQDTVPDTPENPTQAKLVFPYENSLCNQGTNATATESTLLFEWEAGNYTDRYELKIEDLSDGSSSTYQTTSPQFSVTLTRGKPYAWYIVSFSDSVTETAQSEAWRFYISGEAAQSYAPFPAEIVSPAMASIITAASGVISLDWNGSDVDNDITGYDIYFGIAAIPAILQTDITETIINDIPVTINTIYFWKIITKDSKGNKSDSGVYQFKVI
jgi:hypothetical protein